MSEYFALFIFFCIACILSCIIVVIPVLLSPKSTNARKSLAYECGFPPFNVPNNNLSIKFYLIAMLFLIFDLEILFIIPWAINLKYLTVTEMSAMGIFLFVLTIGFLYEIKRGGLEWE